MDGTEEALWVEFGGSLRLYRERAGMSREKLSEVLGLSGAAVSAKQIARWEKGHPLPVFARQERFEAIEAALRLEPGHLAADLDTCAGQARRHRGLTAGRRIARQLEATPPTISELARATPPLAQAEPLAQGEQFIASAIGLVEAAVDRLAGGFASGTVTLVSGIGFRHLIAQAVHSERWQHSIQALLNQGWNVEHLCCGSALPAFDEGLLHFLGFPGRYRLTQPGPGGITPSYDVLHVPGVGGILAFVPASLAEATGWLILDADTGPSLTFSAAHHAKQLARALPAGQIDVFDETPIGPDMTQTDLDLEHFLAYIEGRGSYSQDYFSNGLWRALMPAHVVLAQQRRALERIEQGDGMPTGVRPDDARSAVNSFYADRLQRVTQTELQLRAGRQVRIICPASTIEGFVRSGQWEGDKDQRTTTAEADRVAVLEKVLHLLEETSRRGNLQIALIEGKHHALMSRCQWATFSPPGVAHDEGWRCHLLFAIRPAWGSSVVVAGRSDDPNVIATFKVIFEGLWEDLPAAWEANTIVSLKRAIATLKRR